MKFEVVAGQLLGVAGVPRPGGGRARSHRRGLQVTTLLCCRFSLGWTRAVLIVSHSGAEQAFFFFSGPVLQNDSQPFEKKNLFPKIVKILKKKNKKKRFKSHVVAVHF